MEILKCDKSNWPNGISDRLELSCGICGKENINIDYIVNDKYWKKIVPENFRLGVVCLDCIIGLTTPEDVIQNLKSIAKSLVI